MTKAVNLAKIARGDLPGFSGVIETDGTFVAVTKPFVMPDGSGTKIASIKDAGADGTLEIWDIDSEDVLTGTPEATVTITGAATVTSIAQSMGYIIVGSEDGIHIFHKYATGSWAEATTGWPRSLNSTDTPNLNNNDVIGVAAGVVDGAPTDPNTGGKLPSFGVNYGTGVDQVSVITTDGNVWDAGTVTATGEAGITISQNRLHFSYSTSQYRNVYIPLMTADQSVNPPYTTFGTGADTFGIAAAADCASGHGDTLAVGSGEGLTFQKLQSLTEEGAGTVDAAAITASITSAYNTGYMVRSTKGAWLMNSATVGRGTWAKTLTENGTVTSGSADGASGELLAYSGWSLSNYLNRANDADFDFGTTPFCVMGWFKTASVSAEDFMLSMRGTSGAWWLLEHRSSDGLRWEISDGTTSKQIPTNVTYADSEWHFFVGIIDIGDTTTIHVDGVLSGSLDTSALTTMTPHSTGEFHVGVHYNGTTTSGTPFPGSWSLLRVSATVPSDAQIRAMYDAEKGMFETGAKVLLQSSTTDAVLDVDVDPNGKVAVTQTDSMTVWDGLTCTTQATLGANTAFEHLKSWNDTLIEVGATDLSISRPAQVIRTVFDEVKVLQEDAAKLNLGEAKAWIQFSMSGSGTINASYNVESITDGGSGIWTINFATPFKSSNYAVLGMAPDDSSMGSVTASKAAGSVKITTRDLASSAYDATENYVVCFGELEGE